MKDDLTPRGRRRLRDAALARDAVLLLAVLFHLLPGACRRLGPPAPAPTWPEPLLVDVARDPPERLALLPGIGRTLALRILADRLEHGPIERLEDLCRIDGIGPGTVERLRRTREVRIAPAPKEPREAGR